MYDTPRIGDLVWFTRKKGDRAEVGQLRDVKLGAGVAVVSCRNRDQVTVDASLVQCRKLITDKGPLGDGSISWEEWQYLDPDEKERLAWPYGSGK